MGVGNQRPGTRFIQQFPNGLNKLECYIALDWKGLPRTNTLAYWAHLKVTKKMKCCEFRGKDT
jgi:hypothetical protein